MEKGLVKMQNFSQSKLRLSYAYFLTPIGVWLRGPSLWRKFLKRKVVEYETFQVEIDVLRAEMSSVKGDSQ